MFEHWERQNTLGEKKILIKTTVEAWDRLLESGHWDEVVKVLNGEEESESEEIQKEVKEVEVKPIITMKNFKRGTRVELLGIDISTALTNFDYSTQGDGSGNNAVTLEINIEELTKVLCGITPEGIKNAKEILAPYKEAYDRDKEILSGCKTAFKINRRKLFDVKRAKK